MKMIIFLLLNIFVFVISSNAQNNNTTMEAWKGFSLNSPTENAYSYSKQTSGAIDDSSVEKCQDSVNKIPSTNNSVVDFRCKLVTFEVCMNKSIGTISQSQDSLKQCEIMKGLAGPRACAEACSEAAKLPTGGNGSVTTNNGTYNDLTPFAVACFKKIVGSTNLLGEVNSCGRNEALQCLINSSKHASINAKILEERKNACKEYHSKFPNAPCIACINGEVRLDYDPKKIDLDCSAEDAKLGKCVHVGCTKLMEEKGLCKISVIGERFSKENIPNINKKK